MNPAAAHATGTYKGPPPLSRCFRGAGGVDSFPSLTQRASLLPGGLSLRVQHLHTAGSLAYHLPLSILHFTSSQFTVFSSKSHIASLLIPQSRSPFTIDSLGLYGMMACDLLQLWTLLPREGLTFYVAGTRSTQRLIETMDYAFRSSVLRFRP